jgi:hypothetical protein
MAVKNDGGVIYFYFAFYLLNGMAPESFLAQTCVEPDLGAPPLD